MIYYLIPEYVDSEGDCCRVRRSDGETVYKKTLHTMIKGLYDEKCLNLRTVKFRSSRILNRRNLIPLYLGGEEILVPFKARASRVSRDPGYGYFNLHGYKRITDKSIILKDGAEIMFLDSRRMLMNRIEMAELVGEELDLIMAKREDADRPEIVEMRSDVKRILREIEKIKIGIKKEV